MAIIPTPLYRKEKDMEQEMKETTLEKLNEVVQIVDKLSYLTGKDFGLPNYTHADSVIHKSIEDISQRIYCVMDYIKTTHNV